MLSMTSNPQAHDRHEDRHVQPRIGIIGPAQAHAEEQVFGEFLHEGQDDEGVEPLVQKGIDFVHPGDTENHVARSGQEDDGEHAEDSAEKRPVAELPE